MRKIILLLIGIILVTGCAGSRQYAPQASIQAKQRNAVIIANYTKIFNCLKIREDGATSRLRLHSSKTPNAWVDIHNDVFITAGLLEYGEDAVTFAVAHELAHAKLKHVRNKQTVSMVTTGAMIVANTVVPGAGLLDHVVNPAITNNYSKSQELEADKLASDTLKSCLNMPLAKQIEILQTMRNTSDDGGGFWSAHPSWETRIKNINR